MNHLRMDKHCLFKPMERSTASEFKTQQMLTLANWQGDKQENYS